MFVWKRETRHLVVIVDITLPSLPAVKMISKYLDLSPL